MLKKLSKKDWRKIERVILVLTFLVTAAVGYFSIRTSKIAVEATSLDIRPWVSIPKIDSTFQKDEIRSVFIIENIGKVPLYYKVQIKGFFDEKPIDRSEEYKEVPNNIIALMPGEVIKFMGIRISGDTYRILKETDIPVNITQEIRIDYGISRNDIKRYYVSQTMRLDYHGVRRVLEHHEKVPGIWIPEKADFK